jgi:hypothetical protein
VTEASINSLLPQEPVQKSRRATFAREWIIFAISMGLGGHVVLGIVLHAPEAWPWEKAGGYAVLVGLSIYVAVQVGRSLWWAIRGR